MKNTTVVSYEKSFSKQRSSYKRLATFDIPKQLTLSLLDNTMARLFYSQGRLSVPAKIALINYYSKVESVGCCRFQFHLWIPTYVMRSEFTREAAMKFLAAQFS